MRTYSLKIIYLGAIAGALVACGSNAGLPDVNPSIAIRSPANNSSVNLSASKQIAVGFDTNYTIRAPATCNGQDNCGHIYLMVDNSSCNGANQPYNTLVLASPADAQIGLCPASIGMHTITLELHHDDGSLVNSLFGNPVIDKVTITAQ